jgi:hypothetical protein
MIRTQQRTKHKHTHNQNNNIKQKHLDQKYAAMEQAERENDH